MIMFFQMLLSFFNIFQNSNGHLPVIIYSDYTKIIKFFTDAL